MLYCLRSELQTCESSLALLFIQWLYNIKQELCLQCIVTLSKQSSLSMLMNETMAFIPITELWNSSLHNWKICRQGESYSSSALRPICSIILLKLKRSSCECLLYISYILHLQLPLMKDSIPLRFSRHDTRSSICLGLCAPIMITYSLSSL